MKGKIKMKFLKAITLLILANTLSYASGNVQDEPGYFLNVKKNQVENILDVGFKIPEDCVVKITAHCKKGIDNTVVDGEVSKGTYVVYFSPSEVSDQDIEFEMQVFSLKDLSLVCSIKSNYTAH